MYIRWNYIEDEMQLRRISNNRMAQLLEINIATWSNYKHERRDIPLTVFYNLLQVLNLNFYDV
ncbi:helix-turn-helix domain-containing protein, partial [Escherichia coli]|uniref:helix-turn-helix domain-containing protein n=1 Tax=Escherichia coli TaxID=562 RepID=UPI00254C9392